MIGKLRQFNDIRKNPKLAPRELEAFQLRKLRALFAHAYESVPYYRSLFRSAGISPKDIRSLADLRHIPTSNKDDLRRAGLEAVLAQGSDPDSLTAIRTSGTTGTPFTFYLAPDELKARGLIEFRDLVEIGFRPWDRLVVLGPNPPIKKSPHQRLGLFRTERIAPILPIEEQIRRLKALKPTILWAYPAALRALLESIDGPLSTLCQPRALVTSAEMFQPSPKDGGDDLGLDLKHFNFYGCMESGRIAWECPAHQGLHVCADNVILEVEPLATGPIDGNPAIGEAVITTLNTRTMPFIRYRLGDLCQYLDKPCSCGRSFPLIAPPIGRTYDLIRMPSGRVLSPYGVLYFLREFKKLRRYRITQVDFGRFLIELVVQEGATSEDFTALEARLRTFFAEPIALELRPVPAIETHGTKFKVFVSKLPRNGETAAKPEEGSASA
ncbi:phenylacetate--CoA ligase family protein [Rhodospirillaceae bacterium SYSU D60014]|uniref:phenylacetate--CoA ligase family protein n=1 Tax=Virgifigura deserti TaxID=2268457 RepID=UPI000E66B518